MALLDKLMKTTRVKGADILSDSKFFSEKDLTSTPVGMVNVALSGSIDGGLASGLTVLAGPSKHFKTSFALLMAGAYLKKHKDAALIFYDSEFGSPQAYFESFDIDTSRVLHCPVTNIEELKFDLVNQLKEIERKDKVIVIIDSVGNIASKKEVEDAINEKSVAVMTRAKALKGLFRMVTPFLTINDIPLLAINHTYQEQGLFPKQIVSGGCVVAGTEIQTATGPMRIEDVKEDDVIITNYGENTVSHIWNPETLEEGNPECFEVEFEDGYRVTCSAAHKFLVNGEWIEAQDLTVDMVCETTLEPALA